MARTVMDERGRRIDMNQNSNYRPGAGVMEASMDEAKPSVKSDEVGTADASGASTTHGAVAGGGGAAAAGPPLFEEFYDDWAAFDQAVASAVAKHHPIRKRSSLTFDVYNRTVSKGKHDRRSIAEFLSKTFKCTHGIKFRPRSSGKRSRHKLRDIGCPFHLYASAVEYGPTYRVKVRVHDQHNHPIGPDAIKAVSSMRNANGELSQEHSALVAGTSAATSVSPGIDTPALSQGAAAPTTSTIGLTTAGQPHPSTASAFAQQAPADAHSSQAQAQTEALSQAFAQVHAQALLKAQEQVQALSHARAQAMLQSHHVPTSTALMSQDHHGSDHQSHSSGAASTSDLLDSSGHDSETLLARAIESTIDEDVFISGGPASAVPASVSSVSSSSDETMRSSSKFEPTLTLEALRRRVADFADERDWNQFHTPRNLLLALTGEVGELCEIFQWKGECKNTDGWSAEEKEHLGEELSDVMIYLIRLADKCNVDLPAVLNDKTLKNGIKYPAELVKGSSKKYSQYKRMRLDKESVV